MTSLSHTSKHITAGICIVCGTLFRPQLKKAYGHAPCIQTYMTVLDTLWNSTHDMISRPYAVISTEQPNLIEHWESVQDSTTKQEWYLPIHPSIPLTTAVEWIYNHWDRIIEISNVPTHLSIEDVYIVDSSIPCDMV